MLTDDELARLLERLERTSPVDEIVIARVFDRVEAARRAKTAKKGRLGWAAMTIRATRAFRMTVQLASLLLVLALVIAVLAAGMYVGAVHVPWSPVEPILPVPDAIRPATVRIRPSAVVGLTGRPGAMVAHDGAIWVANGGAVSRIDPATDGVVETITVGTGRAGIGAGPAGIWVSSLEDGTVAPLDPTTGTIGATIAVQRPEYVAVGTDDVWVSSPSTGNVTRIDAGSGRIMATIFLGNAPSGITLAADAVLVGHDHNVMDAVSGPHDGAITIIDRTTGAVVDIPVTSGFGYVRQVLLVGDQIWYTDANLGGLVHLDRAPDSLGRMLPVGERLGGAAVVDGRIWVTINPYGEQSAVVSIDPQANVVTSSLGPGDTAPGSTTGLGNVVAADGSLWVTADWPDRREVLRIDPLR